MSNEKRIYRVAVEFTVEDYTDSKAWGVVWNALGVIGAGRYPNILYPNILDIEMGKINDVTDEVDNV
jgi:hypothetical protein